MKHYCPFLFLHAVAQDKPTNLHAIGSLLAFARCRPEEFVKLNFSPLMHRDLRGCVHVYTPNSATIARRDRLTDYYFDICRFWTFSSYEPTKDLMRKKIEEDQQYRWMLALYPNFSDFPSGILFVDYSKDKIKKDYSEWRLHGKVE